MFNLVNKADIIIIGAGIMGLSFAYEAIRQGKSVTIIEKNESPISASIRNFGFVTVTGQSRHKDWSLAKRSSQLWLDVCKEADIEIAQRGSLVTARHDLSLAIINEFYNTEMAENSQLLTRKETLKQFPFLSNNTLGSLLSDNDLRINPAGAISKIIKWLHGLGAKLVFNCQAHTVMPDKSILTNQGTFLAKDKIIIAACNDLKFLFPDYWKNNNLSHTKLQMLNVSPDKSLQLDHTIMSDLSMVFYPGFNSLPSANELINHIKINESLAFNHLIHIIVAQNSDGSFVIGDSHEYIDEQNPFLSESISKEIINQASKIFKDINWRVNQQWIGYYPYTKHRESMIDEIYEDTYIVSVNRGKGMTLSWVIAKDFFSS